MQYRESAAAVVAGVLATGLVDLATLSQVTTGVIIVASIGYSRCY